MVKQLCVCALLPSLSTSSSLTLLLHEHEARKPTNSGRLAALCLRRSRVVVVEPAAPSVEAADPTPAERRRVLLFPGDGATVLTRGDGPVDLVVPDGTWKQVKKMRAKLPSLSALPCVTLPSSLTTSWQLRKETRDGGLSTFEAIAAALGIVEGADVEAALFALFRVWVDRTLWLRGQKRDDDVEGGIPAAARLHDPRGGLPPDAGSTPPPASSVRSS